MSSIPAGYAPSRQSGRYANFKVAVGDFIHGKIVGRELRHSDLYNNDSMIYDIEVVDAKLTDYTKKDGTVADQSSVKAGDLVHVTTNASLARMLEKFPDGHSVYVVFKGKLPTKTKKGLIDMNTYEVYAPKVETADLPDAEVGDEEASEPIVPVGF